MDYDVIIVGSGAGGGTLARKLAESGTKVLVLERGERTVREPANWDAKEVFGNGRYLSPETWLDRAGRPFRPEVHYTVGGATKFYGAALFRLRDHDFGETGHYGGISPAWPVSAGDLDKHYTQAEAWYHVQRLPHAPVIQRLADTLYWYGWNAEAAPSAVLYQPGPCVRCATCDGFPCQVAGKGDAETCGIDPALATGNVTLLTGVRVTKILRKASGAVAGVHAEVDSAGNAVTFTAPVVVLAAGAVNSAALWLASGIPDKSDQVGRNYMCHQSQAVLAVGTAPLPRGFHKTLAFLDFYRGGPDGYPLGSIQMAGQPLPAMLRGESRLARLAPGWPLREIAARSLTFWLMSEDLPDPRNRVTLERDGQVRLAYQPGSAQASHGLYRELAKVLPHAGYPVHMKKTMPLNAVAHQCGTLRMAATRDNGPVQPTGEAWSTPGLFVADASVFVSSGAVNPALTVMAWALRVAEGVS